MPYSSQIGFENQSKFIFKNKDIDEETAKKMILNNSNVNEIDADGKTALMYAAEKNYVSLMKLLIENGADVNIKDKKNRTAIMYASKFKKHEAVQLLANNKNTEYITEMIELCDRYAVCGAGHSAIILCNNKGKGYLYDYAYDHPKDKNKKTLFGSIINYLIKSFLMIFVGLKWKADKTELENYSMRCIRNRAKINIKTIDRYLSGRPIIHNLSVVEKGCCAQWEAEEMCKSTKKYKLFSNNCITAVEKILRAGGVKVPNFIIPIIAYKNQIRTAIKRQKGNSLIRFQNHSVSFNKLDLRSKIKNPKPNSPKFSMFQNIINMDIKDLCRSNKINNKIGKNASKTCEYPK